jgi:predicted ester cyclase
VKTFGAVLAMVVCLAVGFATGFKTALVREHSRLEHNKQILRRALKEVWSNSDLNAAMKAADELYTPDFVLHDWTGDSPGLGEAKKGVADTRAAFPDWHEELLNVVAEGNIVVTRSLSTGTQKGDIAAIPGYEPAVPANGKFQQFPEMSVHRLVNGKIAEQWTVSDNWGANIQGDLIDPRNWSASALCLAESPRPKPSR